MDTAAPLLIDGRSRLLRAGEIHYFRLPRSGWRRRLDLLVEAGADTVASYLPWVVHEDLDGEIDLVGRRRPELDLGAFLDEAATCGLQAFVRPGPFTMGELRHEGVPGRLRSAYPHLVPRGWDGAPATTSTLDYRHPDFLAEVDRWYAALGPVLAPRMAAAGGPIVGVQLDNEIGMLSWVSNTPDLTDRVLAEFDGWLTERGRRDRYPAADWARTVRSPGVEVAADLRVDLADFLRDRYAGYVDDLADRARAHGFGDGPLYVNVHGTEAAGALNLTIGTSQLQRSWAGRPQRTAGSDHYVGTLTTTSAAELHLVHAFLAATLGPQQPLTALEFEAGTGDYGGTLAGLTDPSAVLLKTRLALAQGTRALNWYLFAGGANLLDPAPDDDGTHRFGITGQRHGSAAPVTPEGERGPAYASTAASMRWAAALEPWASTWTPEYDDLAVGYVPDHWATEFAYPGNRVMAELVAALVAHRGAGPAGLLPRMLLAAGFRYGAVDLQHADPAGWPRVVALGCGPILDEPVQRRLLQHVEAGGGLLLHGDLPVRDGRGRDCRLLAEALDLAPGEPVLAGPHRFPSVVGAGAAADLPELRCGRIGTLVPGRGEVLLRAATGDEVATVRVTLGAGAVTVLATDASPGPAFFAARLAELGVQPRLRHEVDGPGLITASTATPAGERFVHLINVEGYPLTVRLWWDGTALFDGRAVALAPRTGRVLPFGAPPAGFPAEV